MAVGITGEESTICPKPQQNIVISISKRANLDRYSKIRQIYIQGKHHEVNTYETAPHNKSKAVIHSIPVKGGPQKLDKTANPRNPLALAAKCIGNTTTAIVALDRLKVPNYIRY